jgi:hypothetical protein
MPLIPQQIKKERGHLQMRIDVDVLGDLESYCRFIHSSRDFVVENALQYLFKKDREFQEWLAAGQGTGNTAATRADSAPKAKDPTAPAAHDATTSKPGDSDP